MKNSVVTYQQRWQQFLEIIKNNVSESHFDTWFKPMSFEKYDEEKHVLIIQLPSAFIYEFVEAHFLDLMRKALMRVFGPEVILNYRIITDKKNNISQDIEPDIPANIPAEVSRANINKAPSPDDSIRNHDIPSQLNPHYTFNNFIEGTSNIFSRSIGLSVAEHPDTTKFNPMFIYGPSGCGKTHLINAIGVRTKELYPAKRVLYVSARLFQVQFTNASLNKKINDFINFYQTIDLLIIDDVQEWINKDKTQNAFFHIFNHLFLNGKRIIFASDRPPVDLKGMPERLLTRFSCGLVAELERPNIELCKDILKSKMRRDGLKIPEDVVDFVAENANGSVRDLEGVINSLMAYSVVYNSPIDMELALRVVKRSVKVDDSPLTMDDILQSVADHFDIGIDEIKGKSRQSLYVEARQAVVYLAQKHTKMPAKRIGKWLGGRDHSTILHCQQQAEKKIQTAPEFENMLTSIEKGFNLK